MQTDNILNSMYILINKLIKQTPIYTAISLKNRKLQMTPMNRDPLSNSEIKNSFS